MTSMEPPQERSAGTPAIPSFASLRGPVRRSPVDVLLPGDRPAGSAAPSTGSARPPEWADLLHLAVHVVRWSLHAPVRRVRRFLGT